MTRWIIAAASCCITVIGVGFAWHGPGDTTDAPNRVLRQDTTRHEEGTNVVERELGELRGRIAGREKQPATEVFKNIQLFKTMEAGRLPGVMGSWCNVLGVTCKHCHVIDQWEKEDRPEKQIARDMVQMVGEINTHLLKNIKNLDSPEPKIGCWTCHRGKLIPEFAPPREKKN
jgi:hypothetical protein